MREKILTVLLAISVFVGLADAAVLWEDDFSSYYGVYTRIHDSNTWTLLNNSGTNMHYSPTSDGRAYYYNGSYGDATCRIMTPDGVDSHHLDGNPLSDYTVSIEGEKRTGYTTAWRAIGRIVDAGGGYYDYVYAEASVTGGTTLYFRVGHESAWPDDTGWNYAGSYDENSPVQVTLTMSGTTVIGKCTHNGISTALVFTTDIVNTGDPGFGGYSGSSYPIGYFDNFKVSSESVALWPRTEENLAFACRNSAMPIWPKLPVIAVADQNALVMSLTMPKEFEIKTYGTSPDFAIHPAPLYVPTGITSTIDGDLVTYEISLPVPPDSISSDIRPALLLDVNDMPIGDYTITMGLKTADDSKTWEDANGTITVLDELEGRKPERLALSVHDYVDYNDTDFRNAIADAAEKSGISEIVDRKLEADPCVISQQLISKGVDATASWFWERDGSVITDANSDARIEDVNGDPVDDALCYTWCIANPNEAKAALVAHFTVNLRDYTGILNDNEEKAYDGSEVYGDLYTPLTINEFKSQYSISDPDLTPAEIAQYYSTEWVEFRCWQSQKMSELLYEAVKQVDSGIEYGVYSGYPGDSTRRQYSWDWAVASDANYLDYGTAGYGASIPTLQSANAALGDVPFIPAINYIVNFGSKRLLPGPDEALFELLWPLFYSGSDGGIGFWYLQVMDGAGFHAMSKYSSVVSQIEDVLIDGSDAKSSLDILPSDLDTNDVFAYTSGDTKAVAIFNHDDIVKSYALRWTGTAADNVDFSRELTGGECMDNPDVLSGELAPNSCHIYVSRKNKGKLLFSDNFNSYKADGYTHLEDTPSWSATHTGIFKTQTDGRIYHYLGVSGDTTCHIMQTNAAGVLSDGTVSIEGMKLSGYYLWWNAVGRVSGSDYVYAEATVSNDNNVYVRVGDSTGAVAASSYVCAYNSDYPVHVTLTMDGINITATAAHTGYSTSVSKTTTIVDPGYTGFAGKGGGGYPLGCFNNFEVYGYTCDCGTCPDTSDLNEDCKVDFVDFAQLSNQWTAEGFYDDFEDYPADGNDLKEEITDNVWFDDAAGDYFRIKPGLDGSAVRTFWYSSGSHKAYVPSTATLPADQVVTVDFMLDDVGDGGWFGISTRRQSDGNDAYARIFIVGVTASDADVGVAVNGGSTYWKYNMPLDELEGSAGTIELTVTGADLVADFNWSVISSTTKTMTATLSGGLLNAGAAGIYGHEGSTAGNVFQVYLDNFRVVVDSGSDPDMKADLNKNAVVDLADIAIFADKWLNCVDPAGCL